MIALLLACRVAVDAPVPAPATDPSEAYEALLAEVITVDGYVDYDALSANRGPLDAYVAWLGRDKNTPKGATGATAMYLNAYNAFVMFSVLAHGRPASVLDVAGRWTGTPGEGFFFDDAFDVGRERLSLWEIEHERVRHRAQDVRVHAAMTCASRSCPPLARSLYREKTLDLQLERQMRRWVNDPARGVRVEGEVAVFPAIFDWYAADFHNWTGGDDLCTTATKYAAPALAQALATRGAAGCPHRFDAYDWQLNEAP